ncbi:TPA: hypothetical protein N0F65_004042, partial [Lagenidium giganteum]
ALRNTPASRGVAVPFLRHFERACGSDTRGRSTARRDKMWRSLHQASTSRASAVVRAGTFDGNQTETRHDADFSVAYVEFGAVDRDRRSHSWEHCARVQPVEARWIARNFSSSSGSSGRCSADKVLDYRPRSQSFPDQVIRRVTHNESLVNDEEPCDSRKSSEQRSRPGGAKKHSTAGRYYAKRCSVNGCSNIAVSKHLCRGHGGGRRCGALVAINVRKVEAHFVGLMAVASDASCRKSKRFCVDHLLLEDESSISISDTKASADTRRGQTRNDGALGIRVESLESRWIICNLSLLGSVPDTYSARKEEDRQSRSSSAAAQTVRSTRKQQAPSTVQEPCEVRTLSQKHSLRVHANNGSARGHYYAKRCCIESCSNVAVSRRLCRGHGGGRRCQVPGCTKCAQSRSRFCWAHGGGKRCEVEGCSRSRKSKRFCVNHVALEEASAVRVRNSFASDVQVPRHHQAAVTAASVPKTANILPSLKVALRRARLIDAIPFARGMTLHHRISSRPAFACVGP